MKKKKKTCPDEGNQTAPIITLAGKKNCPYPCNFQQTDNNEEEVDWRKKVTQVCFRK